MNGLDFNNPFSAINGGPTNGITFYIMQSDENTKKVLEKLNNYYYINKDIIDFILNKNNINENDFTAFDIKRINNKIKEINKGI